MGTQRAAVKTKSAVRTNDKVDVQVAKVSFAVIGISSCAIGLWAVASLVGGMVASGGPVALAANWLKAVIG
ncbi:hypothetical protein [Desulfocastanea catecholica]